LPVTVSNETRVSANGEKCKFFKTNDLLYVGSVRRYALCAV